MAEIGPTSNFVGNHMTQGAIDMVQALLKIRTGKEKTLDVRPPLQISDQLTEHGDEVCHGEHVLCHQEPCIPSDLEDCSTKSLHIVEWKKISEYQTLILLERPFTEDITSSMTLSTVFDTHFVQVEFSILSKDNVKKYNRRIDLSKPTVSVDMCGCYLGSGTIEEMRASENLANKTLAVQHSDPSTMICILVHTPYVEALAEESPRNSKYLTSPVNASEAQSHLAALKSFIRKTRV